MLSFSFIKFIIERLVEAEYGRTGKPFEHLDCIFVTSVLEHSIPIGDNAANLTYLNFVPRIWFRRWFRL